MRVYMLYNIYIHMPVLEALRCCLASSCLVYAASGYLCIRPQATSVYGLKLLGHKALSY